MFTNRDLARIMREMAAFYEMEGVAFRPAAYERAAESLETSAEDAAALLEQGGEKALRAKIPGVGAGIAEHIRDLLAKGTFKEYARFKKRYPLDILGLTAVENVGPKTAKALYQKLKIKTVDDLERAAQAGRIRGLPRFGRKTEENILKSIAFLRRGAGRRLLGEVLPIAERLLAELRSLPEVKRAEVAGSIRRRQETIGDLDILVTTSKPEKAMAVFTGSPEVAEVLEHGPTKTTVRLKNGMNADVRVVPEDAYGAALQYFTGDKEHNVLVRRLAIAKGLKLNEYGLWRGAKRLASRTEEEVYAAMGLACPPPEIRTASGEIEAATVKKLPKLIPYGALKGDLQVQTDWTDGAAQLEKMAETAVAADLEYIAVTDHTRTLAMTGGLDEKKLKQQMERIDSLNAQYAAAGWPFRILKGAEVNILKDGSLDIADETLAELDFVGAAIHSHFDLPRAEQTARLLAAVRHPHVDAIFHPTGRLIGSREPLDLDMEAVIKEAARTHTVLEVDAMPDRLDLRDAHVRLALRHGVKLCIDSDAHHPEHYRYLPLGLATARRGWATALDVINTWPVEKLLKWLKKPKNKRS